MSSGKLPAPRYLLTKRTRRWALHRYGGLRALKLFTSHTAAMRYALRRHLTPLYLMRHDGTVVHVIR